MYSVIIAILVLGAFLGAPLFVVIGGLAMAFFASQGVDLSTVTVNLYRMTSLSILVAIPLFTFAGYLLAESKSPERLVRLYRAFFSWLPGGMAVVALIACSFFTAFTGASGATIIALGGLLHPILLKEKYPEKFSLGLLTTCGSLGLLFPPSLPLILYALVAKVNVDELFLAGVIPGTILILALSLFCIITGKTRKVDRQPFSWTEARKALKEAFWLIPLPLLVLGGIYGGIFTPFEAAAIAVVYVLFVEMVIYRDINWTKDLPRITAESMTLVGGVLLILGCALGFTDYLIDEQIPMKAVELMRTYIHSQFVFLIVLNIFLLIVGCLMDMFSAIVVLPLVLPIAKEFGIDPIHLGIIFLVNLEIGYSTPPMGLNLFIASFRFQKKIPELYKASLPFLAVLFAVLILITYVPELSLFLVDLFK